jgi:phage portal protein BeeE
VPNLLTRFRDRASEGLKSAPVFPAGGGQATYGGGAGGMNYGGGWGRYWLPGTNVDYSALAGDLWQNSAVAACLNWLITNFPEAAPCVKNKDPQTGKRVIATDSPLAGFVTDLLENPNDWYDDTVLWAGTLISFNVDGNAYWQIERDENSGKPIGLWYTPHFLMTPRWDGTGKSFITHYEYRVNQQIIKVPVEDVIHFRFGVDPYNARKGMAPLASIVREVYTDTEATNYSAAVLKNFGIVGGIASPKDPVNTSFDPEEFTALYKAKTTGDRRGEIFAIDVPLDINFPNNSPESMALDRIRAYPESRICAVMGIPAMVVGLMAGLEHSTFSNYENARKAAWEDNLLPTYRIFERQMTRQFLRRLPVPTIGYFIGFDTGEIRALQEDQDAKHTRAREDFKANLLDRAQALSIIGVDGKPEDEGLYHADIAPPASGGYDEGFNAGTQSMNAGATLPALSTKPTAQAGRMRVAASAGRALPAVAQSGRNGATKS